jgi:hypothetical protein
VYGRRPPSVFQFVPGEIRVEAVAQELRDRDEALKQLKSHLLSAQEAMKQQADKHRCDVQFRVGEWVYVKLKPYRQQSVKRRIHPKLAAKFFGPFQIVAKLGPVAYKLLLPVTSKIHPVFHVSLLKKAVSGAVASVLPPELEINANDTFTPVAILDSRSFPDGSGTRAQWLVQWTGQPAEEATWEDISWIKGQFPNISLEDKTVSEEASSDREATQPKLLVYSRRGRKGITNSG